MESSAIKNKDKLYGNHHFYHNDGSFMFHHNDKRVNWYMDRDLISIISTEILPSGEEIKHVQFKFVTKGSGHGKSKDEFYSGIKENKCVISGIEEFLTKHHIVPSMYRRHFPMDFKSHGQYHDVLLVGVDQHDEYEKHADLLKDAIAREIGLPTPQEHYGKHKKLGSVIKTIKRYGHIIPKERLYKLFGEFKSLPNLLNKT